MDFFLIFFYNKNGWMGLERGDFFGVPIRLKCGSAFSGMQVGQISREKGSRGTKP